MLEDFGIVFQTNLKLVSDQKLFITGFFTELILYGLNTRSLKKPDDTESNIKITGERK